MDQLYDAGVRRALEKLGFYGLGQNLRTMQMMFTKTDPRTGEKSFGWNPPSAGKIVGGNPITGMKVRYTWDS